jgi:hypothetical protein
MRRTCLALRRVSVLALFVSAAALASGGPLPRRLAPQVTSPPVRINATTGLPESFVPLETLAHTLGAPSLDSEYDVIHVGGEAGVLYAVQVPF